MYKFDEQALRRGINMGLGSQGIWTPELENVMFDEITNEALHIHSVVGRSEQLICPHCGKYKKMQGNGIMHQLCECGE